jgi:hypothetical protein
MSPGIADIADITGYPSVDLPYLPGFRVGLYLSRAGLDYRYRGISNQRVGWLDIVFDIVWPLLGGLR